MPAPAAAIRQTVIRVLIADDYPVVRIGLKAILEKERDMTVVGEAKDAREVIDVARKVEWDVGVIDYDMPGNSGVALVERMRRERPGHAVLIISMHPEQLHAVPLIRAGASGYMNKDSAQEELAVAIRKIARGGKYVSVSLAEQLADFAEGGERAQLELLSDREYRVMRLLAEGRQLKEIARQLFLSPSTVSSCRTRILRKLKLQTNADLIRYAEENNLAA